MKKALACFLCLVLVITTAACGSNPAEETPDTTTTTILDTTREYLDANTTTVKNEDGTTTVTLTPPTSTVSAQKSSTTTTKKRTTTTDDGKPTSVVAVSTTTTKNKPAPVPTLPKTTTQQSGSSTTFKKTEYTYVTGQKHTPLPMEERYFYSLLDEEWKGYYRKIDEAVRHLDERVYLGVDLTKDNRHQIYFLYMMDTPELFYLSNHITMFSKGENQHGLAFSYVVGTKAGEYSDPANPDAPLTDALRTKIQKKVATFNAGMERIISTIPSSAPDAVKERLIHDRLVLDNTYNQNAQWSNLADDNFTAYGGIINKTGVCESYAEAFQALCFAVGINCTEVVGTALGGDHEWNAVKLDGEWYHCDVTFDDPIGGNPKTVSHQYFNLTAQQMKALNHNWSGDQWHSPECKGTKYSWDNYRHLYGE